jgi:hypothetical protein
MKKLLLLCAYLLALTTPLRAAVAPPEIVVVRVYEGIGKVTLIITHGEGKSEKVEFGKGATDKNLTQRNEGYYWIFQHLYQQGYVLQSTFSAPRSPEAGSTTLLITKLSS